MATHSSILDQRIPGTEEPGGLQSMGVTKPMLVGASTRSPTRGKGHEVKGSDRQSESGLKGASLDFLEHLPPKPESACLTALCFSPTFLTLTGGCPPTTFFWKKLIQSFQIISLLGIIQVLQSKNPSDGFLACLQDSYSCTCDCLRPPDGERQRKLETSWEYRGFRGVKIIRIGLIKGFIC